MFNKKEEKKVERTVFENRVRHAVGGDDWSEENLINFIADMKKDFNLIFGKLHYPADLPAAIDDLKADKDNLARSQEENIRLQRELNKTKEKLLTRKWLSEYTDDELEKEQENRHLAKMIKVHLKPGVQFSLMDTDYVITAVADACCYCWYPGSKAIDLQHEVILRTQNLI